MKYWRSIIEIRMPYSSGTTSSASPPTDSMVSDSKPSEDPHVSFAVRQSNVIECSYLYQTLTVTGKLLCTSCPCRFHHRPYGRFELDSRALHLD
jgi:hypothetical protein